jgi:CBS domain-containing protein
MPVTMKVKDVMDTKVFSLDASSTVDDAIKSMIKNGVWSLIVERRGLPEGVVTERDVIRRCLGKGMVPSKTSVGSIASSPLVTIDPNATLREAMDVMAAKDIRRLFVVDKGKIIGRVTQTEVFQSTLSVMEILSSLSNTL